MNKESLNLYAELLLQTVATRETQTTGTAQQGLLLMDTLMKNWHISPATYRLADGSGVSRYTLVTPTALTDLLVHL
jgi:D-alanyl-D-alanine carboxypeptidase/D-alanyl-D-alanine-endopeptidase (penicillin-binding protein 4)